MLTSDDEALRKQLQHVYWIGGGSCAGKSTVARRIAAEQGFHLYLTDDVMADHAKRSAPQDCPHLHEFMAMDMDQRWVNRLPEDMLETFHWFRGEAFNMIVEDVLRLSNERGVIVEGFRLLPQLVKPLIDRRSQAVWLLPTREFRQAVVDGRGGPHWGFIAKTNNPERALRNLLERDALFTNHLYEEAQRLGLNTIDVDPTMTVEALTERVTEALYFQSRGM